MVTGGAPDAKAPSAAATGWVPGKVMMTAGGPDAKTPSGAMNILCPQKNRRPAH